MQEEILTRLDSLAEKLGVAAHELFAIYVRQAPLEFVDVAGFVVTLAILFPVFKFLMGKLTAQKSDHLDNPGWFLAAAAIFIALVVVGIATIDETSQATKAVLNPEYYAFSHLSEFFK